MYNCECRDSWLFWVLKIHGSWWLSLTFAALHLKLGNAAEKEMEEWESQRIRTEVLGNVMFCAWHSHRSHDPTVVEVPSIRPAQSWGCQSIMGRGWHMWPYISLQNYWVWRILGEGSSLCTQPPRPQWTLPNPWSHRWP